MSDKRSVFIMSVLAGVSISIGGAVFLSLDNKVLGAVFFTVGLFMVCTFGFNLFTGKVCYVFDNDRIYALNLILIWFGNLVGCLATAGLLRLTRVGAAMAEKAAGMCEVKLSDGPVSIFILAFFCDILIYVAVQGYKNNPHELGKYLSILFGVTVFILCGFEHCVANMFYFSVAWVWSPKAVVYILIMTAGNAVGGVAVPLLRKAAGV